MLSGTCCSEDQFLSSDMTCNVSEDCGERMECVTESDVPDSRHFCVTLGESSVVNGEGRNCDYDYQCLSGYCCQSTCCTTKVKNRCNQT